MDEVSFSVINLYTTWKSLCWWKKVGVFLLVLYVVGIVYQIFFEKKTNDHVGRLKREMERESRKHLVKPRATYLETVEINDDAVGTKEGMSVRPHDLVDNTLANFAQSTSKAEPGVVDKLAALYTCVQLDIVRPYIARANAYVFG